MLVHDVEFTVSHGKLNNLAEATVQDQILQELIEYMHWEWSLHHQ